MKLSMQTVVFDFSKGKRVRGERKDGSRETMDKFSICYFLQHIDYYRYLYWYDCCKYAECAEALKKELLERNYEDVTVIA